MDTNESEPVVTATEGITGKNMATNEDAGTPEGRGCLLAAVILFGLPILMSGGLAILTWGGTRLPQSEVLLGRMVLSLWLLLACGAVPLCLWPEGWAHEGFRLAVGTGTVLGLLYGLTNGYFISSPFLGACIGAATGYILHLNGMPRCEGWQLADSPVGAKAAATRTAAATAAVYAAFYILGLVTPTPLIPAEQAAWVAAQDEKAKAANPKGKLTAFKAVVAKFKQFPDRFTPDSQREAYNQEMGRLVREFTEYPFDAKANPSVARSIVELYESKIKGNYSGYQYNLVDECVRNIYSASLDR